MINSCKQWAHAVNMFINSCKYLSFLELHVGVFIDLFQRFKAVSNEGEPSRYDYAGLFTIYISYWH